jgi:hypothetical protein
MNLTPFSMTPQNYLGTASMSKSQSKSHDRPYPLLMPMPDGDAARKPGPTEEIARPAAWKNPSKWVRTALVALPLAMAGALCGAMAMLFIDAFVACTTAGALLGAMLGVTLEIRSPSDRRGADQGSVSPG